MTDKPKKTRGLKKGFAQVPQDKKRKLIDDIKKALRVTTDRTIERYKSGERSLQGEPLKEVRRAFLKYGVNEFYDIREE